MPAMRGIVRSMRRSGNPAWAALALVLLFRLLVPAGYMVGPDSAGRPGLVLCGGAVGATVAGAHRHGHEGRPIAPAPSTPGEHLCPFAALAAPPLPPSPTAIVPPPPAAASPPAASLAEDMLRPALAAPPPPATGPPSPV